jgi:hypothetical protein
MWLMPSPSRGAGAEPGRCITGSSVTTQSSEERVGVGLASGGATGRSSLAARTVEEGTEEVAEAGHVLGVASALEAPAAGEPASSGAAEPRVGVAGSSGAASALVGLPVRTELVIGRPLLGVREDLIGLADLFEAFLRAGVALVDVGMVLAGKAEGGGNVYISVGVTKHAVFSREGADLTMDLSLTLGEALLGADVHIATLSGRKLALTIPAGTQNGRVFRLTGQGLPRFGTDGDGDIRVRTKVVLPTYLDDEGQEKARAFIDHIDQTDPRLEARDPNPLRSQDVP